MAFGRCVDCDREIEICVKSKSRFFSFVRLHFTGCHGFISWQLHCARWRRQNNTMSVGHREGMETSDGTITSIYSRFEMIETHKFFLSLFGTVSVGSTVCGCHVLRIGNTATGIQYGEFAVFTVLGLNGWINTQRHLPFRIRICGIPKTIATNQIRSLNQSVACVKNAIKFDFPLHSLPNVNLY